MKYVALLRGINVGGKSLVKMADLKQCLKDAGFKNIATYINSGNVIFESEKSDRKKLVIEIEHVLAERFEFDLRIVLRTHEEIGQVVKNVPPDWNARGDMRCYVVFVREPVNSEDVLSEMEPKVGVDFITKGSGVVYMSTLLSGIAKSGMNKLIGKKIYKEITIRNYNTVKKILLMMEKID